MIELKPNIPILQEAEIWKRNQEFKHWGRYKVFRFVNGEPTFLVSSYASLSLLIMFNLAFGLFIVSDIISNKSKIFYVRTIIRIALLLSQAYFCYIFYRTNPGISSHSLPIINELQLARLKNFCEKCKCMQSSTIKHCQFCDICIESSNVHSNVLKTCISQKNIKIFCALWSTVLAQSLLNVIK